MMTFYSCGYMIYPRRIAVYLAEKGISDIETIDLDLYAGQHQDAAYLAVNPAGSIPALMVEPGFVVNETSAILEYLEEAFPRPNLLGRTPRERARTRELMSMMNDAYLYACNYIVNVSRLFEGRLPQDPVAAQALYSRYRLYLGKMESIASGGDCLDGDVPSYADCSFFASAQYFDAWYGEPIPDDYPKLRKVYERFSHRASAAAPAYPQDAIGLARERIEGFERG